MSQAYINATKHTFEAVEFCISNAKVIPALILIYTLIDNASWLSERDRKKRVGERFRYWVDSYLLPNSDIKCTSKELYSARCSILHTLTTDVTKEEVGVRGIQYAFGDIEAEPLQEKLDSMKINVAVVIHINDLYSAYRKSLDIMFKAIQSNDEWKLEVDLRASKAFASLHGDDAIEFTENRI